MADETAEAAQRCMVDKEFAQAVLDGEEGNDEVRQALLADLADNAEVSGFDSASPTFLELHSWSWGTQNGMTFDNLQACCTGGHFNQFGTGSGTGKVT